MRLTRLSLTLFLLIACLFVWTNPGGTTEKKSPRVIAPDELERLPAAEKEAVLRRLNEEWTQLHNELDEREAARTKLRDEIQRRREGQPRSRVSDSPHSYSIDPLLKKANDLYNDFEHRNRDEVVRLFTKYLEGTPDSVFTGEVYAKMGSMYSYNANVKKGENIDPQKMQEYFQHAHFAYGGKYDSTAAVVYNYLTFTPGTLASRMEYYDWLLHIQSAGILDDMHEIRSISECAEGRTPEYSVEELEKRLAAAQSSLPGLIRSIEKQMFGDAFQTDNASDAYVALSIMARRYPHTELGRQAQHQVDMVHERINLSWDALADTPVPETSLDDIVEQTAVVADERQGWSGPYNDGRPDVAAEAKLGGPHYNWLVPAIGGVALTGILLLSVLFTHFTRRQRPIQGVDERE